MKTIAVIEDNHPVRKGMVYMINKLNDRFEVIGEAANGTEGYAMILERKPQIILTDIRLPGISGLQMIKDVLEVYSPQVIVVSAYSEFSYAKEAIDLGVLRYLVKPVEETQLIESLDYAASKCINNESGDTETGIPLVKRETKMEEDISRYTVKLKSYIKKHFADNITVSDIADALNLSESHLNRIFKKDTGYAINEFRIIYKMYMACRLLIDENLKVFEISSKVGMENQQYFSVCFKKYVDMTPLEFRERYIKGDPAATEILQKLEQIVGSKN